MRIVFLAILLLPTVAVGHINERGMDYNSYKDSWGTPCCTNRDCQAAEQFKESVENGREVIHLLIEGLWITVPRAYVIGELALDGRAHWCGVKLGTNNRKGWRPGTRCVILPPRLL